MIRERESCQTRIGCDMISCMKAPITQDQIQIVVDKIVKEFQPEKVILFGSYAWGKPHEDSDVDLFVVKKTDMPTLKRIEALDRMFPRRQFPMDFLVYTPEQVQRRVSVGDLFVREIINKGHVLYAQ